MATRRSSTCVLEGMWTHTTRQELHVQRNSLLAAQPMLCFQRCDLRFMLATMLASVAFSLSTSQTTYVAMKVSVKMSCW